MIWWNRADWAVMWTRSCLALAFLASFLEQAVLAPHALKSAVADGKVELADQAARAEGGKSIAQFDQLPLDGRRSFEGLVMTSAEPSAKAGRAIPLEAARSHLRTVGTVVAKSCAV